jgi:hypothetical protein
MSTRELPIPPEVNGSHKATEVVRGWIVDRHLLCTVLPEAFEDPQGWGVLLADLANHIADGLAEARGADRSEVLRAIGDAFAAEMAGSTGEHTGRFIGVRALSEEEQSARDQVCRFLVESMGEEGRAALNEVPALWLTVGAFGLGAIKAVAGEFRPNEWRGYAIAVEVYTRLGMSQEQAAEMVQWLEERQGVPSTEAMIGVGERAASEWQPSKPTTPRLREILERMLEMVKAQRHQEPSGE